MKPSVNRGLQGRLDSVQMTSNFMSESSFPGAQTRSFSFEDKSITFHPNTMCRDHEYLHEERVRRSFPCNN